MIWREQWSAAITLGWARSPGIGKKTAERLVLELKEKLRGLDSGSAPVAPVETLGNEADRLLSALVGMGYRPGEAERAVSGPSVRN